MAVDLVIKNGYIVSPASTLRGHLVIDQGRVIGLVLRDDEIPEAREVIDAAGKYVLPGLIDPHVHFREPGVEHKEDWRHGSAAAVCGGITTVIDMPNVLPPTSDLESLALKLSRAEGNAYCDYGVYGVLVEGSIPNIRPLADAGVAGFKIFMGETIGKIPAPSDGEILDQWRVLAEIGARCGVHAEDNSILNYQRQKLQDAGRVDPLAFLESRPAVAEAEAVQRAILFAQEAGSKLMIYHTSAKQSVHIIRRGKQDGVEVMAETGPHYLLFDGRDMVRMGLGSMLRMNPPVRERDHAEALWEGLLDGTVDVIGTDHSPHTPEEKKYDDRMGDIWKPVSGWAGVEYNVPVMLTQVANGRLTLNHYVKVQSENVARAWGLWPKKGNLDVGADADVTIVDMEKRGIVQQARGHSKNPNTPFDGWEVKGQPIYTIVRGQVVAKDGELVGGKPQGVFIKRQG